jgi:asparagine synthase (glutamine-hydrolysing)
MCGIAGICCQDPRQAPDAVLLRRMGRTLRHRGPDQAGSHLGAGCGLAMERLSVLDVAGGQQPIWNEDGSVAVVLNGEIYNFRELRGQLAGRGHIFRTRADTEVIVHLYEEHGVDCVQYLHGMFALAIWDTRRRHLLLARDRLGVKPLYYAQSKDRLLFASEIKAILQDPQVPRRPNFTALDQMLRLGHCCPPQTCFVGIHELPPASRLLYRKGAARLENYWEPHFACSADYDERTAAGELGEQLRGAVRRRTLSDVPLGAFLSGGIDSGVVVALLSQILGQPLQTFSIGFDAPGFSELPYARAVARRYRTDHHEFIVKPQVEAIIADLIWHHDAPFYDTSAIPTYHLCRLAREHVTVALSGDGGDELLAGYDIYRAHQAARAYRRVPDWCHRGLVTPLARLLPESAGYRNRGRIVREFLRGAKDDAVRRHTRWIAKIKRETRRRLYQHPELAEQLGRADEREVQEWYERQVHATELGRLLYVDTKGALANDMLVKVDRMSMAHGLEVRSPLLDHTLWEWCARLPDRARLKGRASKHLLREVAAPMLPAEILRRPKRGFSIPLDRWLREDLAPFVRAVLFDPRTETRGLFRAGIVRELVRDHMSGRIARGREIWLLLTIELWHRMYLDAGAGQVSPDLPRAPDATPPDETMSQPDRKATRRAEETKQLQEPSCG